MSTKPDATPLALPPPRHALIGWRLLALFYDAWPVVALWLAVSALFTAGYTFLGGHDAHQNIPPFSPLQWLLWLCCWVVAGLYATVSWRRGGQTLGMRPWRITLAHAHGTQTKLGWKALWLRYAVATLSLLCGGLGFWWAWLDREHFTWHDRISRTRLVRNPKRSA